MGDVALFVTRGKTGRDPARKLPAELFADARAFFAARHMHHVLKVVDLGGMPFSEQVKQHCQHGIPGARFRGK